MMGKNHSKLPHSREVADIDTDKDEDDLLGHLGEVKEEQDKPLGYEQGLELNESMGQGQVEQGTDEIMTDDEDEGSDDDQHFASARSSPDPSELDKMSQESQEIRRNGEGGTGRLSQIEQAEEVIQNEGSGSVVGGYQQPCDKNMGMDAPEEQNSLRWSSQVLQLPEELEFEFVKSQTEHSVGASVIKIDNFGAAENQDVEIEITEMSIVAENYPNVSECLLRCFMDAGLPLSLLVEERGKKDDVVLDLQEATISEEPSCGDTTAPTSAFLPVKNQDEPKAKRTKRSYMTQTDAPKQKQAKPRDIQVIQID